MMLRRILQLLTYFAVNVLLVVAFCLGVAIPLMESMDAPECASHTFSMNIVQWELAGGLVNTVFWWLLVTISVTCSSEGQPSPGMAGWGMFMKGFCIVFGLVWGIVWIVIIAQSSEICSKRHTAVWFSSGALMVAQLANVFNTFAMVRMCSAGPKTIPAGIAGGHDPL